MLSKRRLAATHLPIMAQIYDGVGSRAHLVSLSMLRFNFETRINKGANISVARAKP